MNVANYFTLKRSEDVFKWWLLLNVRVISAYGSHVTECLCSKQETIGGTKFLEYHSVNDIFLFGI
jgi:hypothetical protein